MERIPVTHAGSLIRPQELLAYLSAVDHGRVLAADQRAERRAQGAFQVGRLQDHAAQRVPQLVDIHAREHGATDPVIEDQRREDDHDRPD